MTDTVLQSAIGQAQTAIANVATRPVVQTFFDEATFTASHVVHDPATRKAAIIDSVLDFDQASVTTTTLSAQAIVDYIAAERLTVAWILETHAHADHLSAAPWLQDQLGGQLACTGKVHLGEQHRQLLPTVAGGEVSGPLQGARDRLGDRNQGGIALLVPVAVVESLEVVEITQQQRKRACSLTVVAPCRVQLAIEDAPIRDARQAIQRRQPLELLVHQP